MSAAYVDTSALLAMEFNEAGGEAIASRLNSFSRLFSANLMEAELRSAFFREGRTFRWTYVPASSGFFRLACCPLKWL